MLTICFILSERLLPYLISLEFLALVFFSRAVLIFGEAYSDTFILLFFLIVSVSESVLGLVLYVLFVRVWGKDNISVLRLIKC